MLEQIKLAWRNFDLESIESLEPLYAHNVRFIEPAGEINGRNELFAHFRNSCKNLLECRFEFDNSTETAIDGQGFLVWTMHYRHSKLNGGQTVQVPGTTFLAWQDQITLHRDWFDLGAAVYEHIPLVGYAVRTVKKGCMTHPPLEWTPNYLH